jgi:hypothetical protein
VTEPYTQAGTGYWDPAAFGGAVQLIEAQVMAAACHLVARIMMTVVMSSHLTPSR